MRRIDRLLYASIIPPFVITVVVLTFVLSVHYLGTLSELLISRNASLAVILTIFTAILPGTLVYSMPLSFLVGILIGISGMSGENQITAMRACGIPIRTLLRPILVFGGIVCLITASMTLFLVPKTDDIIGRLKNRVSLTQVTAQIRPRIFNGGDSDFPNIVFYLGDISVDKQYWSKIFLADNSDPEAPRTVMARSGSWVTDPSNKRLQLHLESGASYSIERKDPRKDSISLFGSTEVPVSLSPKLLSGESDNRVRKIPEQSTRFILDTYRRSPPPIGIQQLIELHRRIALPFSIFPFALLGLTLSVSTPKAGRTSGFAISLVLVILFYMLFFNGLRLASVGKISPWMGAWGADFILAVLGLILFYKVEQMHAIGHWIAPFLQKSKPVATKNLPRFQALRDRINKIDDCIIQSTTRVARLRFPKVLDLYISRGFLSYFAWSLVVCGTLFVLFTLFDLLDDIIRNQIPASIVIDYFTFFTPQILMLVVPMSILLAVLINFGILEKNSEITAIKAGGWSLYRIAIPVFLIATGFCCSLYLLQDYILPFANERQDDLRNQIKGRPPQTHLRMQRKWILGESNRIYNYEYFDTNKNSFVDLNIYDIDLDNARIVRWIRASRARIHPDGEWSLEDGWIRHFQNTQSDFRYIRQEKIRLPERAGYFKSDVFQPKESAKKTYLELRSYISALTKSGYNATELQIELHKKISFPLSCLIMVLLGVPFSFSTGKRGAFFGIGTSIAIAISYWGISSMFEAMGAYGFLIPVLAAWAPNILFAAAGLALLFTIRT